MLIIKKLFRGLDRTVESLVFLIFFAMVVVGAYQVFSRYCLNHSLSWSEEFQKYCHIWIIALTIPIAYNRGSHIGMEVLLNRLPKVIQKSVRFLTDLLWLVLGVAITYYTTVIMAVAQRQTSPGLSIRMDRVYLCLVIGGAYLAIVAIRKLFGQVWGNNENDLPPSRQPTKLEDTEPC